MDQAIELLRLISSAALIATVFALILQVATKTVANFKPPYGMSYKVAFLSWVAAKIFAIPVKNLIGGWGLEVSMSIPIILAFLVGTYTCGVLIKDASSEAIGFKKGAMVSMIWMLVNIMIAVTAFAVGWWF